MVEISEEEKVNMKRDISCNVGNIKELQTEFKLRDPARKTYEFINKVTVDLALMQKEQQDSKTIFDEFKELNDTQHQELKGGINDIRGLIVKFIWGIAITAASIIIYYVLNHVGLTNKF